MGFYIRNGAFWAVKGGTFSWSRYFRTRAKMICCLIINLLLIAAPAWADRWETIVTVDQDGRPTSETWIRETDQGDRRMEDYKSFAPAPAPAPALNDPPPSWDRDRVSPQQ
jgi:hypothetical protein